MGTSGLGPMLVAEGLLSETDRRTIKKACGMAGAAFARSIVALGLLDEDELATFLTDRTTWSRAPKNLLDASDKDAIGAVDRLLLERLEALPLKLSDGVLEVAVTDPLDHDTLRQLAFFSGYRIVPVIATLTQIRKGLKQLYKGYRPPSLHLEQFLANHATAASRRIQLQDKRRKPPSFLPPPSEPKAATTTIDDVEVEQDDEPFEMPPPLPSEVSAAPAVDLPEAAAEPDSASDDLFLEDGEDTPAAEAGDETPEEAPMAAADPGLELDFEAEASADLGALDELDGVKGAAPEPAMPAATEETDDPFGDIVASGAETTASDDMNADLADDLLGGTEEDAAAMPEITSEDDPLSSISGADAVGDIFNDAPAGPSSAGPQIDLGKTDAAEAAANRSASLNRAMLDLTMAADFNAGVRAVAPALSEAGLTRGLTLESDGGGNVVPIAIWQPQAEGVTVKHDGLQHFVTPGLRDALGRLFPGWTPLSDAVRDDDLAPLAEWSDARVELMATMTPGGTAGKQLVVLASWQHERLKDDGLKKQTLDVIRKLAKKL